MIIPILISAVVLLLVLGGGAGIWFIWRKGRAVGSRKPVKQATIETTLVFHWSYIILPAVFLLLSIIIAAYFYPRLPVEVAYHFQRDGSPDRWLSRGMILMWLLLPQLFLTVMAGIIAWGMTRLAARFWQSESSGIKPAGVLSVMGNMVALPQVILCFAMLDIFSYNSYQIHLLPLWVFALIIMGLGGIILGVFFVRVMLRAFKTNR